MITKEILEFEFLINNKSVKQICKEFNMTFYQIRYLLTKFKIVRDLKKSKKVKETKHKKFNTNLIINNPDRLYEEFIIKNRTRHSIANEDGVSDAVVKKRLQEYKIKKPVELYHKNTESACKDLQEEMLHKRTITMKKRYGTSSFFTAKDFKTKSKQTCLKKYGVEYTSQIPEVRKKSKQTCLKKYGTESPCQSNIIKQKIRNTNLKKYGVECFFRSKYFKQKAKQTLISKYGVDNSMKLEATKAKARQTYSKNNTWSTSKDEEYINILLLQKFSKIERQYRSQKYPFNCDFYIPELDLYIEYQGTWSHGGRPFIIQDNFCKDTLKKWKSCAKKLGVKSRYNTAIEVWTKRDPEKRKIAKENNLNWIEFFTIKEFKEWYDKL